MKNFIYILILVCLSRTHGSEGNSSSANPDDKRSIESGVCIFLEKFRDTEADKRVLSQGEFVVVFRKSAKAKSGSKLVISGPSSSTIGKSRIELPEPREDVMLPSTLDVSNDMIIRRWTYAGDELPIRFFEKPGEYQATLEFKDPKEQTVHLNFRIVVIPGRNLNDIKSE